MKSELVKGIFFWFAVVLLGGLILFQVSRRNTLVLNRIPVDPKPAPNFTLQNISLSDYKGKQVLLHFWATWCQPCRDEMPLLIALNERLKDKLVILAVAVDSSESDINKFFGDQRPDFPILIDSKHQVASLYGISQFPETLLINADGQVSALYVGPQNWDLFL
ncbi:MAG: TlpA disulfide reductase family protein [Myxococcaceae bacterium]